MLFPNIFKGEHIKDEKAVAILSGHEITVKFDRPCALQIDGETILNVTEYTVKGAD
jgi:diacylglycerol kinase family enzyme